MKVRQSRHILLAVFAVLLCFAAAACAAPARQVRENAGEGEVQMPKQQIAALDTFFSNFAETDMPFFAPGQLKNDDLVNFGVQHVLMNAPKTLRSADSEHWAVPAAKVGAAVRKYFGRDARLKGTSRYALKGNNFLAVKAGGEAYKFAQIIDLTPLGGDRFKATVMRYAASSGFTGDPHGMMDVWQKDYPEDTPQQSAAMTAVISRSKDAPKRYILKSYQPAN